MPISTVPPSSTSLTTTKGDLQGYDTAATRVPVGADTFVLTADSTLALGLKWAASAGGTGTLNIGLVLDLFNLPTLL